jgi:hypothetical protein
MGIESAYQAANERAPDAGFGRPDANNGLSTI